jgi:hypothetical protein
MKHTKLNAFEQAGVQIARSDAQRFHSERVEHRQRVNGQSNGYEPISEAELQALRAGRAC